jgi:hypothetical protein
MGKCSESLWLSRPAAQPCIPPDHRLGESVRPAYSAGGTADCIARCQLLPAGPDREQCILDCY